MFSLFGGIIFKMNIFLKFLPVHKQILASPEFRNKYKKQFRWGLKRYQFTVINFQDESSKRVANKSEISQRKLITSVELKDLRTSSLEWRCNFSLLSNL